MGRYSYWYRFAIPTSRLLKRKFYGDTINKNRVWRHHTSEITCSELLLYKMVIISCLFYSKIIHSKLQLGILLLVVLLIILFN